MPSQEIHHVYFLLSSQIQVNMVKLVAACLVALAATGSAFVVPATPASVVRNAHVQQKAVGQSTTEAGQKLVIESGNCIATIYALGACVTSFKVGDHDYLAIRPDAKLDGSKPISGGLPFCFPQFGPGEIQQHGFARNLEWEVASTGGDSVTLTLVDTPETRAMWDHAFKAEYTVALLGGKLATTFKVTNTGASDFTFQAALHSYFSCADIDNISIQGNFEGASFLDKTLDPPAMSSASGNEISISGPVDSVYYGVSGDVNLVEGDKKLTISNKQGWEDTVVWSPYGDTGMGYKNFVCVESGKRVANAVTLAAGQEWVAKMNLEP
ncbi:unnamed protein product [Chrysoparadoxa australica]